MQVDIPDGGAPDTVGPFCGPLVSAAIVVQLESKIEIKILAGTQPGKIMLELDKNRSQGEVS